VIRVLAALAVATATSVLFAADAPLPQFVDATREAGIAFQHVNGASPDKHLVETMGSGGLFFDYDGDGWIDVFLVDGGSLADPAVAKRARHRLYHNRGNGTFEDVTDRSGIRHSAYGMGACAADYDGDGDVDLYITNDGPNVLYQNRGDGRFVDVTAAAGVGEPRWSASCAFADLDRDGDLDLWVTNYVAADRARSPFCGDARRGVRFYCHPLNYDPLPNTVYRNDGGTFTDVTAASGVGALRSNGLGVLIVDADDDGWPDVFVANDSLPNYLFRNAGKLRFREEALTAGVAVAADGQPRAGMGIDAGDYDGDGRLDLAITNLDFQMHSLHRGLDHGLFAWSTIESGIGYATLPFVGFGVGFLDADNDGRLDLAIANGHILDNAPAFRSGATYRQRKAALPEHHGAPLRRGRPQRGPRLRARKGRARACRRRHRQRRRSRPAGHEQRPDGRSASQRPGEPCQRAPRPPGRHRDEPRRHRRARAGDDRIDHAAARRARRVELSQSERRAPAFRPRRRQRSRRARGALALWKDRDAEGGPGRSDRHD
jgi:hypothetical protein